MTLRFSVTFALLFATLLRVCYVHSLCNNFFCVKPLNKICLPLKQSFLQHAQDANFEREKLFSKTADTWHMLAQTIGKLF